jgi:C1A family cysteine protease
LLASIVIAPNNVSVDAKNDSFKHYKGGILNSKSCGHDLDHKIAAIGYGEEDGQKYFLVRNSWGTHWGE